MKLDEMLSKRRNERVLIRAMEAELLRDPVGFFKSVLMPLLPKESRLSFENEGVVQWQTLLGTTVTKEDLENAPRGALNAARRALPEGHSSGQLAVCRGQWAAPVPASLENRPTAEALVERGYRGRSQSGGYSGRPIRFAQSVLQRGVSGVGGGEGSNESRRELMGKIGRFIFRIRVRR